MNRELGGGRQERVKKDKEKREDRVRGQSEVKDGETGEWHGG